MKGDPCTIEDCAKPVKRQGYCGMHFERVRKWGDPHYVKVIIGDEVRRFWTKVDKRGPAECWPWLGTMTTDGYGQFKVAGGGRARAHRYAYELVVGPIPEGLHIDHVKARGCTRTDCVNPTHLEPVTPRENGRRGDGPAAINSRKSTCSKGHEYDLISTDKDGSTHRWCSVCRRENGRIYREQRKSA